MDCKICQSDEPTLNTHEMFSFFSNDDDGDDDVADYENVGGVGGVSYKWISTCASPSFNHPQVHKCSPFTQAWR